MKRHFTLSLILFLALVNTAIAGTVAVPDAQQVAINFYRSNSGSGIAPQAILKYTKSSNGVSPDFYVLDMSTGGFVIVAADDHVIPILGYSDQGNFRTDFRNGGVTHWVNRTASNIRLALQNNVQADAHINSQWSAYRQGLTPPSPRSGTVSPLCTTTWDQENENTNSAPYLYNIFCPHNSNHNQRSLTGCEATAMGQIMKFWNYPAQGVGSFSYADNTASGYSNDYGTLTASFAHTYDWASMPNFLNGAEPPRQDSAISRLLSDCGISIGMDYGDDNQGGSAANGLISYEYASYGDSFSVEYSLLKYFKYDEDTIKEAYEANYSASAWTALLEHELDMGRPILYEGVDTVEGGHAWVCDGYDASNHFHMNWGWGGADNGYFAVNDLTTTGNFNPASEEDVLMGIMPKHISTGIDKMNNTLSFNVFPNPANNELTLQTSEANKGMAWDMKDILGQTVVSINAEEELTHLNISAVPAGIYFITLHDGDRMSVKKVTISH